MTLKRTAFIQTIFFICYQLMMTTAHAVSTLNILHSFNYTEGTGADNQTAVILDNTGRTLYGVTKYGGNENSGTIFKLKRDSSGENNYSILYHFPKGKPVSFPYGHLTLSHDGRYLFGSSGSFEAGAIFQYEIDQPGSLKELHAFSISNFEGGIDTSSDIVQSPDGQYLYGVTESGGTAGYARGSTGILYRINLGQEDNPFTILHSFGNKIDGGGARNLVMSKNGRFLYGTTQYGGKYNCGIVYQFDLADFDHPKETILDSFECTLKWYTSPEPHSLILSNDEKLLYGLTTFGKEGGGSVFQVEVINALNTNKMSVLYSFNTTSGHRPTSQTITNDGKTLYGTLGVSCQDYYCGGIIYQMDLNSPVIKPTTVYEFNVLNHEGNFPQRMIYNHANHSLYGTTIWGGDDNSGEIFKFGVTAF